jgi:diguanylate cyclase (GGDEF)-like protein
MPAFARRRVVVAAVALLWLAHVGVVVAVGSRGRGPLLSDLVQLTLGGILIYSTLEARRRSEGLGRSFWSLATFAYLLWFIAQSLGVYNDFFSSDAVAWIENLLFCFWFVPLAMAMVLDPEHEAGRLDTLTALDLVQAVLVCVAAYLYFFYLPKADASGGMSHEVWAPYFVGYGFVAVAFMLRGFSSSRTRDARALFGRIGVLLAISACVDALYYYGPGRGLRTGSWFDLLWSALLVIPTVIACTWKQVESPEFELEPPRRDKNVYTEIFYLIYPLLVLFMSLRIARERLGLAALVVLLSFVCSSARLLVTQHRMQVAKEALRREAAHDSLTGLWNHKSILEILDRELLRAERDGQLVGLIMADIDHFKKINDSRGHAAGDAVLRIIASAVAAVVRPYDAVGRYGGEEFVIVAPGCGLTETWELAERVRSHVAACSILVGGAKVQVSMSLGITAGQIACDSEPLLRAADQALYRAKNNGRNRVEPRMGLAAGVGSVESAAVNSDFWL